MGYDTAPKILDVEVIADRPDLIPAYQSDMAAGLDLRAACAGNYLIPAGQVRMIHTGVRLNMLARRDVVGLIFPRSGLASKEGIVLANTIGVIDADYQGEIILAIRNVSGELRRVTSGQRLAQLVFLPILVANLLPVTRFSTSTARGEGGFGSTGGGSGMATHDHAAGALGG